MNENTNTQASSEPPIDGYAVLVDVVINPDIRKQINTTKKQIDFNAKIEFQNQFLKITGLKVGQIVRCYFDVSSGTSKQSYSGLETHNGIIKKGEDGLIYVESIKKLRYSYTVSNGRIGRSYKSWWGFDYRNQKSDIDRIQ